MKCKTAKFLYKVIPLNSLRSYLITTHFLLCAACSAELADDSEIGEVIIRPDITPKKMDLWPGIKENILSFERKNQAKASRVTGGSRKWQLGLTGAVLLLIIILVPFLFKRDNGQDRETTTIKTRQIVVKFLMIENRPAKSYYFQSKDANKIIVWVQKTKS